MTDRDRSVWTVCTHLNLPLQFLEPFLEKVLTLALLEDVHLSHQVLPLLGHQLLREPDFVSLQLPQPVTGGREGVQSQNTG